MSPSLSIVVPVLNEASHLPWVLARLAEFGPEIEAIVVDGGSTDGSRELVLAAKHARLLEAGRGRARQMNAGAAAARAATLFFLHGDTLPPRDTPQQIALAMRDPRFVAGSFRLKFDRPSPLLRFYAWCSGANSVLTTYGDQGLFLHRATFERIGGFADLPLCEDIDIQRRLRRLGKVIKLPTALQTSARRFQRYGVLRQQLRNVGIVTAYLAGVEPATLKRLYSDAR